MRTNPLLMLLAATVVLVLSIPHQVKDCPRAEDIQPCSCEQESELATTLTCGSSVKSIPELWQIIARSTSSGYTVLQLQSLPIDYIPADIIESKPIQALWINGTSLDKLFDRPPRTHLQELLELGVQSVHLKTKFNFELLTHMRALNLLHFSDVSVPIIGQDFQDHVTSEVTFLTFSRTSTQEISRGAFSKLKKLDYLAITENEVTKLQRDVLPFPSNLKILFLNKNRLSNLPMDMFFGMPKLRSVSLMENQITTLDEINFIAIWDHLRHLMVDGNPLNCDCNLKWLLASEKRNKVLGTCSSPKYLQDVPTNELTPKDFEQCD